MADQPGSVELENFDSDSTYDSDASEFRHSACHDFQIRRMTPARILSAAEIVCIVWGPDALQFAHCIAPETIPCHLLVEDRSLLESARVLGLHGYSTEPDPEPSTFSNFSLAEQGAYPDSIYLYHRSPMEGWIDPTPHLLLLTPMSSYQVESSWCMDSSKTLSLADPEANRQIRFPTWSGYLNSLIATYLEPSHPRNRYLESNLRIAIASLIWSKIKKKDRSGIGQMSEAEEEVLVAVNKENQLFVKRQLVFCIAGCWEQWRNERRRVLTGEYEIRGCSCTRCAET